MSPFAVLKKKKKSFLIVHLTISSTVVYVNMLRKLLLALKKTKKQNKTCVKHGPSDTEVKILDLTCKSK